MSLHPPSRRHFLRLAGGSIAFAWGGLAARADELKKQN
jgi:hypothetical protein